MSTTGIAGRRPGGAAADPRRPGRRPDQLHRAGRRLRAGPLDHVTACSPRSRPTTCSNATPRAPTARARCSRYYAARHDPWSQVARLAEPGPRGRRRRDRRDGQPRRRRAARPSCRSRRSTRPTCSAPATGRRSTCRRTARRWARCSTPSTRCRCPTAGSSSCTEHSLRDSRDLQRQISTTVRRTGYAVTRGELEIGLDARGGAGARSRRRRRRRARRLRPDAHGSNDNLDDIGRLLTKHATSLSQLLRPRMRTKGVA